MCVNMVNVFQRVEPINEAETGVSLFFDNYQLLLFWKRSDTEMNVPNFKRLGNTCKVCTIHL